MDSQVIPISSNISKDFCKIKFSSKKGCSPTACTCIISAIFFLSLGAAAGVYFGLQFLDTGEKSERIFKGSFVVVGGDKYTSNLANTFSNAFQEKARTYQKKLENLYKTSIYEKAFHKAEILALNKGTDQQLIVHFNLHLSPEPIGLSATDLYVLLSKEVMHSKTGIFKDFEIDYDSINIQERKLPNDEVLDKWVPRRQYPGHVEGLTSTPSSFQTRHCTTINVSFCQHLPYNKTSYPNIVGHKNLSEVQQDLVTYRQILDFECYPLAQEFICQLLQPDCQDEKVVMPCRNFCEEFWKSCQALLLPNTIDCSEFPIFSDYGTCHQKPGEEQLQRKLNEAVTEFSLMR